MSGSIHIQIDPVWSVILRSQIQLEDADQRVSRQKYRDTMRPKGNGYRFILVKRGKQYRSYETLPELLDGCRFTITGKKLDRLAQEIASRLRLNYSVEPEPVEPKKIGHWL